MSSLDSFPTLSQSKTVKRAFNLPVVSDTYTYGLATLTSLASPLQPSLTSLLASLSPVVESQASRLRSLLEAGLPEVVAARLHSARDQVTAGVNYIDSSLCFGLDQMILEVPSLTSPTPALYSSTREAAVSRLTLATTYLASFTMAQIVLKASDSGLETADSLLKLVPVSYSSQCSPLVSGLRRVREGASSVRREGARANGTNKVAAMEDATFISAVSEVLGLHYILSLFMDAAKVAETKSSTAEAVKTDIAAAEVAAAEASAEVVEAEVAAVKVAAAEAAAAEAESAAAELAKTKAAAAELTKTAAAAELAKAEATDAALAKAAADDLAKAEAAAELVEAQATAKIVKAEAADELAKAEATAKLVKAAASEELAKVEATAELAKAEATTDLAKADAVAAAELAEAEATAKVVEARAAVAVEHTKTEKEAFGGLQGLRGAFSPKEGKKGRKGNKN